MTATLSAPPTTSPEDVQPAEGAGEPTLGDLRAAHFARSGFSAADYGEFREFFGEVEHAESLRPVLGQGGTEQ